MQHSFIGQLPGQFMLQDILDILLALPLFVPYLYFPGYALGYFTNVFSFRTETLRTRIALALALSFAVTPITANLLARVVTPLACSLILISLATLAFIPAWLLSFRRKQNAGTPSRGVSKGTIAALCAVWVLLCLASFPDLQLGYRLWTSVLVYDDGLRVAFIDAVMRSGVPPHNPLAYFGAPIPSRYYYYWSTVCALPGLLGHLPGRAVLAASCVWCGFAMAACIGLFFRFFLGVRHHAQRWTLLGTALLAVAGLDLIPTAISWFTQGFVRADMDWWSATLVPTWLDSLLWTPHHIAGLLCCLVGLLLLWPVATAHHARAHSASSQHRTPPLSRGRAAAHILLAACAFASSAGLSVYLCFTFALFLVLWVARLLVRRDWRAAVPFLLAGPLALVLSLPFLHDLLQPAAQQLNAHSGHAAGIITTGLRTSGYIKAHVRGPHLWRTPLLLLDTGVTYIFEFGFFLLVFAIAAPRLWRRRARLSEAQIALCYLLGVALIVVTFLRSEAIQSNDLGMRSALLVQWVLLLWAVPLLHVMLRYRWGKNRPALGFMLYASLLLGLGGTIYQAVLLRVAAPLDGRYGNTQRPIAGLPTTTGSRQSYELRSAEAALAPNLAAGTVAAFNPFNKDWLLLLFDTHVQLAATSPDDCGTPFGGSRDACEKTKALLRGIYAEGEPATPLAQLDAACQAASINVLLVQASDPVWKLANSWVWQRPPLVANPQLRAIRCGTER